MIKILNNENYTAPNTHTGNDIGVHVSFSLSDDGVHFSKPMQCLGFLNKENEVQEIVEYFYQDYKEFGYSEVELLSIFVDVESVKQLKKVKS